MRLRLYGGIFLVALLLTETAFGKDRNKSQSVNGNLEKHHSQKDKSINDRYKRSTDGNDKPFWANRGKKPSDNSLKFKEDEASDGNDMDKDLPFWGTRGRRDSSSIENLLQYGPPISDDGVYYASNCKNCYKPHYNRYSKERRDEADVPFWGTRGRRNSDEDDDSNYPFWGNRGRRQEEDPFWGARGRRQDELPFWGNRGRRYSWGKPDIIEDPPFWGSRGRRDEVEPFWGSRGRRQEYEPFWGSRVRRENQIRHKENFNRMLHDAIDTEDDNIESPIGKRRDDIYSSDTFRNGRSRDGKLSNIFKLGRYRYQGRSFSGDLKPSEPRRILDDRIYAEEPHYILVARSSRSSGEDDPFFISRGKKKINSNGYFDSSRDRRGAIEELVKSVRNDPYYIARGKKDSHDNEIGNATILPKELGKAKELICATIDLILYNNERNKTKKEVDESDRDRSTILKKLTAQLQMDPYFASHKNENHYNIEDFIKDISVKCN